MPKPGAAATAAKILSRPPGTSCPVVCFFAPLRVIAIGMLNMSTMVVLQNMPASLWVNSTQSCRTRKLGSLLTQPAGNCNAGRPAPSVTTLNLSLSLIEK